MIGFSEHPRDLENTKPDYFPPQLAPLQMKFTPASESRAALRAIAFFEFAKGLAAIAAGIGLVSLAHRDLRAATYALIGHFHLDPEAHYPRLLLDDATWLSNADIRQAVLLALAYAALRFAEGYGLWRDRAWAEWLAVLSGALYLPLEISHLVQHTTVINCLVLALNVCVVAFMGYRLRQRRLKAPVQP
jgi:uncharacterized membrane protein (DUF2068 family)